MGNILRIVIGLAGLTAAAWSASRSLRLRRHGLEADAVVTRTTQHERNIGQGERSSRWISTVEYLDHDEVKQTSSLPGRLTVGDTVAIRYLPDGSERVARAGKGTFTESFAILGATAGAIALTLLI